MDVVLQALPQPGKTKKNKKKSEKKQGEKVGKNGKQGENGGRLHGSTRVIIDGKACILRPGENVNMYLARMRSPKGKKGCKLEARDEHDFDRYDERHVARNLLNQAEVEDLRAKLHETEEKLKQLEHEQGLREVLWRSAFQQVSNIALNASDFVRAMCKDSPPLDVQAQLDRVSVPTTSSIGLSNPIGV